MSFNSNLRNFNNKNLKILRNFNNRIFLITLTPGSELKTYQLSGFPVLKLTANLDTQQKENYNWQEPQLFRQSIDSKSEYPFDITVTMKKK